MSNKTNINQNPQAVESCHELILWMIPILDHFPRQRRFTLGEKLETRLLGILEDLVSAAYQRDKRTLLIHANRQIEMLRHLWRLSYELQAISTRQYEHGSRLMLALGKQVGGWVKSQS